MGWELLALLALVLWCAPLILALIVLGQSKRLRRELEDRIAQLERTLGAQSAPPSVQHTAPTPTITTTTASADLAPIITSPEPIPAASLEPPRAAVPNEIDLATPTDELPDPFSSPPPVVSQPRAAVATHVSAPPVAPAKTPVLEPDEQSISVVTSVGQSIKSWFTGGNTIVRVGILVLLVGVVFLLRLASEYFQTPIELRLAGVALGGLALVGVGFTPSGDLDLPVGGRRWLGRRWRRVGHDDARRPGRRQAGHRIRHPARRLPDRRALLLGRRQADRAQHRRR